MKITLFAALVPCVFAALPASAYEMYLCRFNAEVGRQSEGKYDIAILHDEAGGVALVQDGGVMSQKGGKDPVEARVRRNTASELWLSWTFKKFRFQGSYVSDLDYTVHIGKRDGTIDISLLPVSYPTNIHYTGQCDHKTVKK